MTPRAAHGAAVSQSLASPGPPGQRAEVCSQTRAGGACRGPIMGAWVADGACVPGVSRRPNWVHVFSRWLRGIRSRGSASPQVPGVWGLLGRDVGEGQRGVAAACRPLPGDGLPACGEVRRSRQPGLHAEPLPAGDVGPGALPCVGRSRTRRPLTYLTFTQDHFPVGAESEGERETPTSETSISCLPLEP